MRKTHKKINKKTNMNVNGTCFQKNGWTYISIYGSPEERGYAYGFYCASLFQQIQKMLRFIVLEETGQTWDFFIDASKKVLQPIIREKFHEFYREMQGITDGCIEGGTQTTLEEIIAWNNYITLVSCWYPTFGGQSSSRRSEGGTILGREKGAKDHCSAFIANGDYTTDGKIVVAHNSFCEFIDGQYYNVILDLNPSNGGGHRILMQTSACSIWSGTDFFITGAGFVGTETTIGGFIPYEIKSPISCRIRQAMQYANSLDDYTQILLKDNSGDYANSWLIGDLNTNEIMAFELGLKYHDIQKTKNGYFYGCNVAFNPQIRNLECADSGYCDVRRHQGARQVRIPQLIEENKGKIDVSFAKRFIGDHYDVYLGKKNNPCSRTICSHYDLDAREYMSDYTRPKPFQPRGAIDGAILDAKMAKEMQFVMRYGNSCGTPFIVDKFIQKHPQWGHLKPYLMDRVTQPWTTFSINNKMAIHKKTNTKTETKTRKLKKINK